MRLFIKDANEMSGPQVLRVTENLNSLKEFFEGEGMESIFCEDSGGNRGEEIYTLVGEGGKTLVLRCASERGGGYLKIEAPGTEKKEGGIEFI